MSKPKKEKPTPFRCFEVANDMVKRWDDETLLAKDYREMMKAYGLKESEAINLLRNHQRERGLL
jgi:hypothetical protein